MDIQETKLIDIVPEFMRDDQTVRGLCAAADAMFAKLIDAIHISWWRKYINELGSKELDVIASLIGIPWYDDAADIQTKREVLYGYENVVSISGTADAVKYALKDLFGDVEVIEWPDYCGEPYHFKLNVNDKLTEDNTKRFQSVVDSAKNVRSIMDSIEAIRKSNVTLYVGGCFINTSICETK